jgi:hypothetical protein
MLTVTSPVAAKPDTTGAFLSPLSGAEEVPPRETKAKGVAIYHLSKAETELAFLLIVSRIDNVVAAHIHCGPPGANGPVGVTLYMAAAGGGRVNGVLARGTVTAPDANNACGWADLAAVASAMQSGNTYTNVHTNDGVAPPNTGPGDFPGGEIRGQISAVGSHR